VAFAGLWCAADRDGRFKWEPRRLGVQILPYDGVDFSRVLHALATRAFVVRYRVGHACFGCIPSFPKHQVVNNREAASLIPGFDSESAIIEPVTEENDACPTRAPRVPHACKGEGKGREQEGNGKEGDVGVEPRVTDETGILPFEQGVPTKTLRMQAARPILHYLNEVSGRAFRETESNLLIIASRLEEEGVTYEGVIQMLKRQAAKWKNNPEMADYLRPETLFGKTKFESYYANRELPVAVEGRNSRGHGPNGNPRNDGIAGFEQWNADFQARAAGDGQDGPPA